MPSKKGPSSESSKDVAAQNSNKLAPVNAGDSANLPPNKDSGSTVEATDPFSDIMDVDFDSFIDGYDGAAASMASLSSPSTGLHSKTPFKTPGPSRLGTVPTESPSTQQQGASQADSASSHFVSMLNSINEAFKAEDSQLKRVTQTISSTEEPRPEEDSNPLASPLVVAPSAEKDVEPENFDTISGSPPSVQLSRINQKGTTSATKTPNDSCGRKGSEINTSRKRTATRKPTPVPRKTARRAPRSPDGKPTVRRDLLSRMLSGLSDASGLDWADPLVGGKSSRDTAKNASPSSVDSPTSIESSASGAKGESTAETTTSPPEVILPLSAVKAADTVSKGEPTPRATAGKGASLQKTQKKVSPIIRFGPNGPIQPSSSSSRTKVQDSRTRVPKSRLSTDNRPRNVREGTRRSSKRPAAAKDNRVSKRTSVSKARQISAPGIEDELTSQLHETRGESTLVSKETRQAGVRTRVSETRSPSIIDPTRADTPKKTIEADELSDEVDMVEIADNSEQSPQYEATVTQPPVGLKPVFEAQRKDAAAVKADAMQKKEGEKPCRENTVSLEWGRSQILSRLDHRNIIVNECIRTGAFSKSQDTFVLHTQQQHEPTSTLQAEAMVRQHILTKTPKPKAGKQQSNVGESSETGESRASNMEDGQLTQQVANIRHSLDDILHTITQRTLEFIKGKEDALSDLVKEYQSNVESFIDKVSVLHRKETLERAKIVGNRCQAFVKACSDASDYCDRFRDKFEAHLIPNDGGDRTARLAKMLEFGKAVHHELQNKLRDLEGDKDVGMAD